MSKDDNRKWTRGGKPVKDEGKGDTVAKINRETARKIDKHVAWWSRTPLDRAKEIENKEKEQKDED